MKADAHFLRYTEPAWLMISAEAERVCDRPPVSLRSELERLGRECIAAPSRTEPTPGERRKFFEAKQRQVAEFRRLLVEEGELPRPLQERAAEVVSEMERLYWEMETLYWTRCADLAGSQSSQNARKAHVDKYFESLIDIWMGIGGEWLLRSNIKELRSFIQACATPVIEREATTTCAIAARLRRLDGSRVKQLGK
jgi:hypothetical protein